MKPVYVDVPHRVIADTMRDPFGEDVTWVNRINVPKAHRGKKLGSAMLRRLCDEADAEGVTLVLQPLATGGLGGPALIAWYKRYGFTWDHDYVVNGKKIAGRMIRRPL